MPQSTIKELRAQTGMSQRAFAERFGIPVRTVEQWCTGKRQPPEYVVAMIRTILEYEQKE